MTKIGFIGAGNMAKAMINGLESSGYKDIIASDTDESKLKDLKIKTTTDNKEVVQNADIIILAVKPNMILDVLVEIKEHIENHIIVSIAAGTTIAQIDAAAKEKKIVRVMPNTPCLVGEMAAAYATENLDEKETETIHTLLNTCGIAIQMDEEQLDAVTGLSGSGPAFVAYIIKAFVEAGEKNGLDKQTATKLAVQTFKGTAQLMQEKNLSSEELIDMVSSPNGTTVAGRDVLEKSKVDNIINDTITTATKRSKELGK